MLKSYLKITFRSIKKNALFAYINVSGLGIALACCIVAYLNWDYNIKFDTYHEHAERIYRVNFVRITNGQPVKNGTSPLPLGQTIRASISQIDEVVRHFPVDGNFKVEDELFNTWVAAVDPEFFEIFTFELLAGHKALLRDKRTIFISSEIRKMHFPDHENPLGEVITYINGDKRIEFKVGGIFKKPPQNTSFFSEAFVHFDNVFDIGELDENDWSVFNNTFVTVNNPEDVLNIEEQLQAYVEIQNRAKEDYKVDHYYLDPFEGMAIRAEREDLWNHWFNNSLPVAAAIAPGIMAIFILLIACFNFTNTSIAIANRRIKEIGIRKVMGSGKKQLIAQFLGEHILLTLLALMAGLLISVFLVPVYSAMWPFLDIRLSLTENIEFLGFLTSLVLFTGLAAGSYPAFYISSFQPTSILRGTVKFSGTNSFTRILLTLQYAISVIAIISGFIFAQNAEYQKSYDMGFRMESVVFAHVKNENGFTAMKNELAGIRTIKDIAGSRHSVTSSWYTDPVKFESSEMDVSLLDVGANYLKTIGATIVAGRNFIENSRSDIENSVIVNEELVRTFGWDEPIGKRIVLRDTVELYVVGVVKDIFIHGELWEPLQPMLMRYATQKDFRFLSVQAELEDIHDVKRIMDEKWRVVFPDERSSVEYMEDERADAALVNNNIKEIFIFLGVVAIILSAIGLFSLVSLNIIKKMKEIGIRKVLGASKVNIAKNISREFVIILSIASVLGSVAGYFLTKMLMASIWTYYVPIGMAAFIASVFIIFFVSGITIGGKVLRTASFNPVDTLRDE
ncbi:MAG: ABC transporter permease [Cytophagales bacterium]|nr:ABC transporter permease [Cytophagales bacterium]